MLLDWYAMTIGQRVVPGSPCNESGSHGADRALRICIVATTPLHIFTFLTGHLAGLAKFSEVTILVNLESDQYVSIEGLPASIQHVRIRRKISLLDDFSALVDLVRRFRREQYDLVWSVTPKGGLLGSLAARIAGIPIRLFVFQGEVWAGKSGILRQILKYVDRLTAKCASHVLGVGASEIEFLRSEGFDKDHKMRTLGAGSICGVDTKRFKPDAQARAQIRDRLGIPLDAVVVSFVGRFTRDKGLFDLAAAFDLASNELPNLWLLLAGPDEEGIGEQLVSRVVFGRDRVRCIGFTRDVEHILAGSDIFCLPSYREGFPVSVLEAAAAAVPTIGSRIYGVVDAVKHEQTGLLFPLGEVNALKVAIVDLARNQARRLAMGNAAREMASSDFEHEQVVANYVDYIQRILVEPVRDQ